MTATEVKQAKDALAEKLYQILKTEFDNFEKKTEGFKISRMDVCMVKDEGFTGKKPENYLGYVELSVSL